jgi:hypothetical protein
MEAIVKVKAVVEFRRSNAISDARLCAFLPGQTE